MNAVLRALLVDLDLKDGDRIEMISMPSDPDPIPVGTTGTINKVNPVDWGEGRSFVQLWVTWDDGRTLSPVIPPDVVRVIR